MTDDLEQTIREAAQGPAEAHGDAGGVKQHDLKDLIEVDRYLASKRAALAKRLGIRITRIVPPGAA